MSMQVSYKKQILFGLLFALLLLIPIEIFTNVFVKSIVVDNCSNRLMNSNIYPEKSFSQLRTICIDYHDTNVFISSDKGHINQFPHQYSNTVNINSMGLRGDEFKIEKSENIKRILFLGGSTTFGWYSLDDNGTIPKFLEKQLNQEKISYEVINAGHPGAGSYFEVNFLEKMINLNPDIVIVYDGYNDLTSDLPIKNSNEEIKLKELVKRLDSYSYTPRGAGKILHELKTQMLTDNEKKMDTKTKDFTEEDYKKRAQLWGERWYETCKKFNSDDLEIFIFLQPILGSSNRVMSDYEISLMHDSAKQDLKYYELFKDELNKISSTCTQAIDLTNGFDQISFPIFADLVHMGNTGNNIISEKIYEFLINN